VSPIEAAESVMSWQPLHRRRELGDVCARGSGYRRIGHNGVRDLRRVLEEHHVLVEPERIQSLIATLERAIRSLGLTLAYAPDLKEPLHRFHVSRAQSARQVTYVLGEESIAETDAQDLIAAITRDFPPIAYDI
jgi:hypothetical protein